MSVFRKSSVGIDISDKTIEIIELSKSGNRARLLSKSRLKLETGLIEGGVIVDEAKLLAIVKKALAQAKPTPIRADKITFGLPEKQAYSHIFTLSTDNEKSQDELVLQEALANIPLPADDLLFSHKVLKQDKNTVEILLVAASKKYVQGWHNFFKKLKLEVEYYDIETLAIFRDLFAKPPTKPVCLVDLGAITTNISIFNPTGLVFSYPINIAGEKLTKEIAKILQLKFIEAEEKKISVGLSDKKDHIYKSISNNLEQIVKEIKTSLQFFEQKNNEKVSEIILVGGSSQLKGLLDYFTANLDLPVRLGQSNLLPKKIPLEYLGAVGLARKALNRRWIEGDPSIELKIIKAKKVIKKQERAPRIVDEQPVNKKLRMQKISLLVIVIVGLVAVGGAFWYRGYNQEKQEMALQKSIKMFSQSQTFELTVPLVVEASDYSDDKVSGRVVENIIESAADYTEAINKSREVVQQEAAAGEALWPEPISQKPEVEEIFPLTVKWLIYVEDEAKILFLQKINNLNTTGINYILNSVEYTRLEQAENAQIWSLSGKITIDLDELIEVSE